MSNPINPELREQLAAIEHERWSDWQRYMHSLCATNEFGDLIIPFTSVKHWERQIATPYAELSEAEKNSEREQVDRYWPLVANAITEAEIAKVESIRNEWVKWLQPDLTTKKEAQ